MDTDVRRSVPQEQLMIGRNATPFIFMGAALILLGVLAIAVPFIAGLTVSLFVGFFLFVAGLTRIFFAFGASWGAGLLGVLVGALCILSGAALLAMPVAGLEIMTLTLTLYLMTGGLVECVWAFDSDQSYGVGCETGQRDCLGSLRIFNLASMAAIRDLGHGHARRD